MIQKKLAHLLLICMCLYSLGNANNPGHLNKITSGTIYLTSTQLSSAGASIVVTLAFGNTLGTDPVGYALGNQLYIQLSQVSKVLILKLHIIVK